MISVFIDGDNCPALVLNYMAQYCTAGNLKLKVVANRKLNTKSTGYEMIICEQTKDAADNYIFNSADKKSLVITKDTLLAERLVNNNIVTINDRGTIFDKDNIKYRIQDRNLNLQLASLGFGGKKEKNYTAENLEKFKISLEKAMATLRRRDS